MKRTLLALAFILSIAGMTAAQAKPTIVPIGNGYNLRISNLFSADLHQYFDNTRLAKDFLTISEFYGLSTDFDIGINPNVSMMWVTIQSIEIDPAKVPKLVPVKDGEDYYLPLKLQADTCMALYGYIQRFIDKSDAPQEIREKTRLLALQSFKFMTSIKRGPVSIQVRGGIADFQIYFEPQVVVQDLTNWKSPVLLTIKMPRSPYYLNRLVPEGLMYLETPEDPKNPLATKDSIYIFSFFGLR